MTEPKPQPCILETIDSTNEYSCFARDYNLWCPFANCAGLEMYECRSGRGIKICVSHNNTPTTCHHPCEECTHLTEAIAKRKTIKREKVPDICTLIELWISDYQETNGNGNIDPEQLREMINSLRTFTLAGKQK